GEKRNGSRDRAVRELSFHFERLLAARPRYRAPEVNQAPEQADRTEGSDGRRRSKPLRQSACDQGANRLHAHEHRRVNGHDTAPQFIWNAISPRRIGRGHLESRRKTKNEKHDCGNPKPARLEKNDKTSGSNEKHYPNPFQHSLVVRTSRKLQRPK